jgi:nucleoside-diphosphate-sugar epimerase
MRRVLITGATGFVGSHVARRLVRLGFDVHVFCRLTSDFRRLADVTHEITKHVVDLNGRDGLKRQVEAVRPDHVVHLAAAAMHGGIARPVDEIIKTNLLGTVNLLDACDDVSYRCFVNTGDAFEYGPQRGPLEESLPCQPDSIHSVTKLGSTLYGQSIARRGSKPVVTLRLFSVFGPQDDPRTLMSVLVEKAVARAPLALSRPEIVRDYVHVHDVAELYLAVIREPAKVQGEIFNAGTGRVTTIGELVEMVLQYSQSKGEARWNAYPAAAQDSARWQADMTKTFAAFSWRPRITVEQGLRSLIQERLGAADPPSR